MKFILALSAQVLAFGVIAVTASYQRSAIIPWSPLNATSVDQSVVYNGTYYLSDRTNKGIQVIDLASETQIALIRGFRGLAVINGISDTALSGPDGLVLLSDRKELYAGDGGGSLKVIDLTTNTIIANLTINTTSRVDEMGYSPDTGVIIATIPNDIPPKIAFISVSNRTVIGYLTFPNTSGIEQPTYNPADKCFYVSIPSTEANPGGEINIVDSSNYKVTKVIPLPQCIPAGIVFGPNQQLFVGCSEDQIKTFNIAQSLVLNVTAGNVIANIFGISGVDQVAYDFNAGYYYAAAYQNLAGGSSTGAPQPQVAIIDSKTNTLFQNITTDNATAHSVAVDSTTKKFIVPISKQGLIVYSLTEATTNAGLRHSAIRALPCIAVGVLAGVFLAY